MEVVSPASLDEALQVKARHPDAVPIQGGTDVMVELNFDRRRPEVLLNLNDVPELMYEMNNPKPARPRKVADMTHRAAGLDSGLNARRSKTIADALQTHGYDPAAAITRVTAALREGDIMLLEMQTDGPADGSDDLVPIEWESASYDAIRIAVGMGIVVVEAAGTGSHGRKANDEPPFAHASPDARR